MKLLILKAAMAISLSISIGCARANSVGASRDCQSLPVACAPSEHPQNNSPLLGLWTSAESTVHSPMTYYQQFSFKTDFLNFYQICLRSDGVKITTALQVPVRYSSSQVQLLASRDLVLYEHGISCRASINKGDWLFKLSANQDFLEIEVAGQKGLLRLKRTH